MLVFGGVRVVNDPGDEPARLGSRPRLVLARLAAAHGQFVSDDALIDAIWGDAPPSTPKTALQGYVSAVRDALVPDRARGDVDSVVVRDGTGYRLTLGSDQLDLARLEAVVARLDSIDDATADAMIEHSSDELFAEYADANWAIERRAWAAEARRELLGRRFERVLADGDGATKLSAMRAAHEEHPFDERIAGHLMLALYRTGRQRESLDVFRAVRSRLIEDIGVAPGPALERLQREILQQLPSLDAPSVSVSRGRVRHGDLDPTSMLVGRDGDVEAIVDAVLFEPSVTILGPGGVGKTSTADAVVRALSAKFDFPIVIDAAETGTSVGQQLAAALGIDTQRLTPLDAMIADALRAQPNLVVIDTCEAALDEVRSLVAILTGLDAVSLLLVSRIPIGHDGERRYRLDPLSPEHAATLLERSTLTPIGIDRDELMAIADRLDRLPLALEMASARLASLGSSVVRAEIDAGRFGAGQHGDDRVDGVPERHQSLDALVEWSLDLLDESTADLLISCVALSGVYPIEAIETLAAQDEAADGEDPASWRGDLAVLVDGSLVRRIGDSPSTFCVLDTVKDVVERRWTEPLGAARERLAVKVAGAAWADYTGTGPTIAGSWISTQLPLAVDRLVDRGDALAAMLAIGAARHWLDRGSMQRGREVLERVLRAAGELPPPLDCLTWTILGFTQLYQGDMVGSLASYRKAGTHAGTVPAEGFVELVESSIAWLECDFERAGAQAKQGADAITEPSRRAPSNLIGFSKSAVYAGDLDGALDMLDRAYVMASDFDDVVSQGNARRQGAVIAALQGEHDVAWRWMHQAIALHERDESPLGSAQSAASMALVAWLSGDVSVARSWARTAIDRARRQLDVQTVAVALPVIAAIEVDETPARAAALLGWLDVLLDDQHHTPHPTAAEPTATAKTALAALDASQVRAWRARGAAMTATEMLRLAAGEWSID